MAVLTGFEGKIYNIMIETHETIKLGKIGGGGGGGALQERKGVSCYVAPALITGDL